MSVFIGGEVLGSVRLCYPELALEVLGYLPVPDLWQFFFRMPSEVPHQCLYW